MIGAADRRTDPGRRKTVRRGLAVLGLVLSGYGVISGQLVRLALQAKPEIRLTVAETIGSNWSRPDIVDRKGRLLATDVEFHSLYADASVIIDLDETVEKVADVFRDVDAGELRRNLAERSRRFVWIKRGLTPRQAQRVHDLGLPGLGFRTELRRVYPAGELAGHAIGSVTIDNRATAGLERAIDEAGLAEPVQGAGRSSKAPYRTSLDLGAQHAVVDELDRAMRRFNATAASGLVMDAASGEIVAAASLPGVDPGRPQDGQEAERIDRLFAGTYELGSIYKLLTVAMVLDAGLVTLDSRRDVRVPIQASGFTIRDPHAEDHPLTVREIVLHSSNVGAATLALEAGTARQKAFLGSLGLLEPGRTEVGTFAAPQVPRHWDRTETITIAYGHGLAVAPVTFVSALAALVNGGTRVRPTFRARFDGEAPPVGERLVAVETSDRIREVMRLNVTNGAGTGKRADVEGYRVGGKTGTAEMAGVGGYRKTSVISSFAAAFPMDAPRFVLLVMLFEPQGDAEAAGTRITASVNAAPTTARIVERIAPILGVLPRRAAAQGGP